MDEGYFDYGQPSADFDIGALLARSREAERQRLTAELKEIDQVLADRDDLHDQIVEELEAKLAWYCERLGLLYQRALGKHGKRDRLRTQIEAVYDALRTERRAHWRDCQDLLADRRALRRDLAELDDTVFDALLKPGPL